MTVNSRYIRARQYVVNGERIRVYYLLKSLDGVLRTLNAIEPVSGDANKIDPHTGIPITDARRKEIYEAAKKEFQLVMRQIHPNYFDPFIEQEADELAGEDDDD